MINFDMTNPKIGLQYCSKEYTELLKKNNILISMMQEYDPYENAVAERVNGILKEEFGLHEIIENYQNLNKLHRS